ncbi:MAG: NAD(P)H-hydrate dehydratase [Alphaproteobacteria bacterium]|nr:NAD(P)H-hydrate dehydratase [Alphaproteobacteria bacterium]
MNRFTLIMTPMMSEWPDHKHRVLTLAEHQAYDQASINAGIGLDQLIQHAGRLVAETIKLRWSKRRVLILSGPGHNGDDGRVAAQYLRQSGWDIAEINLPLSNPQIFNANFISEQFARAGLVVDALFGAGLNKAITPETSPFAAQLIQAMAHWRLPILAVDIPSGIHGDSGQIMGMAASATATVTFCRKKPAHLLLPARDLCGEIIVGAIGLGDDIFARDDFINATSGLPPTYQNHPSLWQDALPRRLADQHKYQRGHAVIRGGNMSGAARLSAQAARRIGAGMVTLAIPDTARTDYAQTPAGVILKQLEWGEWAHEFSPDKSYRYGAILIGPGNEPDAATRADALAAIASQKPVILDAGAITAFAAPGGNYTEQLRSAIAAANTMPVLTPHAKEFTRLFSAHLPASNDKLAQTRQAAAWLGAVIIHKGSDSIIAAPGGTAIINHNDPPSLATAGSGDVLAGIIAGLLAGGMKPQLAAAAAVYLHGNAAHHFAKNHETAMIAEDIAEFFAALSR